MFHGNHSPGKKNEGVRHAVISLRDNRIRLDLDDNGRITWLENLSSAGGNIISEPRPLFRAAIFRTADAVRMGENKEDMAFAENQHVNVTEEDGMAVITVRDLETAMGTKDAAIKLTVRIENGELLFGGEITNRSDSCLDELIYPCIGRIDSLGNGAPDLLYPVQSGERVKDVCKTLQGYEGRESLHEITESYPGWLSMSWMALSDEKNCLYYACYDELFHAMSLRAKGSSLGGVTLEMDKLCFVKKDETWEIPTIAVRLYEGSWRKAADEYARWADSWRKPIEPTAWMKKLNGYFLVINKQQYGFECWPYDTLPELYDHAQAHGFDSLGLFGWYHTGHDNNYPDLYVSPTMGGEEGLKKGIQAVREKGGRVTLYYQGHLMDLNSPFYKKEGYKWESRTIWGDPYYEFYPKFCYSDKMRFFSRKAFSNICPSTPLWREMMADRIDWIAGFGADGTLYDQIGGMLPYPCFNEEHRHMNGKPSLSYTQGRLALLPAIRERVKKHTDFAFLSEHITDVYSQFLDCCHGINSAPTSRTDNEAPCGTEMMPELFRYCFPKTLITVRNSNPYMDERLVNYATLYGFKFEMELRYDTDRQFIRNDEAPEKRIYAKKTADLRRKYEDYLLLGTFRADEGISHANVLASVFQTDDGRSLAVLWNDTEKAIVPEIGFDGLQVASWADIHGEGSGTPKEMAPNSLMLLFLK